MYYQGGKSEIAADISSAIRAHTKKRSILIEPFLGGGGSFLQLAPFFQEVHTGDIHPDLVLMWQAVANGWRPPTELSRLEYRTLRRLQPSALRGFAGFPCSFGAKWFGGYASNRQGTNYAKKAAQDVIEVSRWLPPNHKGTLARRSYDQYNPNANCVVYADPPYSKTTGYFIDFDHNTFWNLMKRWTVTNRASVYVSETVAPEGWKAIWQAERTLRMNQAFQSQDSTIQERLFVYNGPNES